MRTRTPRHTAEQDRSFRRAARAWFVVVALAVVALCQGIALVEKTDGPEYDYVHSDTVAYDWIAQDFRAGDFRLAFIKHGFAHRQFLYPLTVAAFRAAFLDDDAAYRWVNVIARTLTVPLIFLAVRGLGGLLAGLACAALYVFNPYFLVHATLPLSDTLFLMLVAATLALITARPGSPSRRSLFAAGLVAGLSYLARPNGLLFAAALVVAFVLLPIIHPPARRWRTLAAVALFAVGFLIAASPSLTARAVYHRDPIYHEYLNNYLWADTYEDAHQPGPPRFDARNYFQNHTWRENVDRLWEGGALILWRDAAPFDPLFAAAWLVAIPLALVSGRTQAWTLALLVVLTLVATPLAWSYRTNPTIRVPYFALYPLQLLIIGAGLAGIGDWLRRAITGTDSPAPADADRANRVSGVFVFLLGTCLIAADLTGLGLWTSRADRLDEIRKVDLSFYHADARLHAFNKDHPEHPASAPADLPIPVKPW
jgi:hypothetical protein